MHTDIVSFNARVLRALHSGGHRGLDIISATCSSCLTARILTHLALAVAFFAVVAPVIAAPRFDWISPFPQGNDLEDIATNGTRFVATGSGGTVMVSLDGESWTSAASGTNVDLHGITWGFGYFVAVGSQTTIIESTDGLSWSRVSVDGDTYCANFGGTINDVEWSGARLVALAGGCSYVSSNGLNWTAYPTSIGGHQLVWVGSEFLTAEPGAIALSPDGEQWTSTNANPNNISFLAYGHGLIVGASAEGIYTSSDGEVWTLRRSLSNYTPGRIGFNGQRFVAPFGSFVITSDDGVTWDDGHAVSSRVASSAAWGNGVFTIVGQAGLIATSSDGISWNEHSSDLGPGLFEVSSRGAYGWMATGLGWIASSSDGTAWLPSATGLAESLYGAIDGSDLLVVVGEAGIVLDKLNYSNAGWNVRTSGTTQSLFDVAFSDALYRFAAVGAGGTIITSEWTMNGTTWTTRAADTDANLNAVAWINGQFVGVGDGVIVTSSDASTWTSHSYVTSTGCGVFITDTCKKLFAIAGNESMLLAVGESICSSENGIAWTCTPWPGALSAQGYLVSVIWTGDEFIAVENSCPAKSSPSVFASGCPSAVWESIDGVVWIRVEEGGLPISGLSGIARGGPTNGDLVLVGAAGFAAEILHSVDRVFYSGFE